MTTVKGCRLSSVKGEVHGAESSKESKIQCESCAIVWKTPCLSAISVTIQGNVFCLGCSQWDQSLSHPICIISSSHHWSLNSGSILPRTQIGSLWPMSKTHKTRKFTQTQLLVSTVWQGPKPQTYNDALMKQDIPGSLSGAGQGLVKDQDWRP